MKMNPEGNYSNLKRFFVVFVLLVVIGVFFAGCTSAETESPSEAADSGPKEAVESGAGPDEPHPADTFSAAEFASLRYVTEEFPPLNYREDGSPKGMAVDILAEIFQRYNAGITVDVCEFLPWDEGYRAVQTGPRTVLFSTARVPGCDESLQWAGPYAEGSIVLFAPADEYSSLTVPDDLTGLRIGAISNTSSIPHLMTMGVPEESIVTGDNAPALVQMLEAGTIDAWSTGDHSGRYFLRQYATHPDAYIPVCTLATNEYFFAFSPDTPEAIVLAFQEGIRAIKNEPGENGIPVCQELLYRYEGAAYFDGDGTEEAVIAVVDRCTAGIAADAPGTIAAVNAGDSRFVDETGDGLYPFVYDVNTTIVADGGNPLLVGMNCSGKTDAAGYAFRDAIVRGALANGTGWVEYVWTHPEHPSLYHKKTYYQNVCGNDGVTYIVCAGMYR